MIIQDLFGDELLWYGGGGGGDAAAVVEWLDGLLIQHQ
jgi:hypothetical protein